MQVGIIGWRGMVGSVLVQRMREERDFDLIDPVFFSTSQAGAAGPEIGKRTSSVKDANDVSELAAMDVLISCQGGEYTAAIGVMEGTFSRPMTLPDGKVIQPTGKKFKLKMATIAHWNGDKFDIEYLFWDNLAFMQQIGLAQ